MNLPALLAARTMIFDNDEPEYFWAGIVKALSDATDRGSGGYTVFDGSWWASGFTLLLEYELFEDVAMAGSGDLFSFTNAANQRFEFQLWNTDSFRLYFSQGSEYAYPSWGQLGAGFRAGRHRILVHCVPGQAPISRVNANTEGNAAGNGLGTFSAPTRFGILRGERFNTPTTTNITWHLGWAWSRLFSQAERRALVTASNFKPVHLIGDSFGNSGAVQEQLALHCTSEYIALSQFTEGGSSMVTQLGHLTANTEQHDSTIVWLDGGQEDSEANALASIAGLQALLPHDRWYYCEPNPGTHPSVVAACGEHFIPITAGMQAANDGSANDLADVANGLWPRSLRSDSIHLNAAGQAVYAGLIHAYIAADGNMPS